MRYFVDHSSLFFDVFDAAKFFGCVVPVAARRSPLLTDSLSALAAKQLAKTKDIVAQRRSPLNKTPRICHTHLKSTADLFFTAASLYDKAIGQMVHALHHINHIDGQTFDSSMLFKGPLATATFKAAPAENTDDFLVAVCVFLLYEFLDNRWLETIK